MKDKILELYMAKLLETLLGMPSELWNRNKIKDFWENHNF